MAQSHERFLVEYRNCLSRDATYQVLESHFRPPAAGIGDNKVKVTTGCWEMQHSSSNQNALSLIDFFSVSRDSAATLANNLAMAIALRRFSRYEGRRARSESHLTFNDIQCYSLTQNMLQCCQQAETSKCLESFCKKRDRAPAADPTKIITLDRNSIFIFWKKRHLRKNKQICNTRIHPRQEICLAHTHSTRSLGCTC